jgi:hypothetical protein
MPNFLIGKLKPKNHEGSSVTHVDNKRLFDAAAGTLRLEEPERKHLHACEVCQGVFYVFVSQQVTKTTTPPKKNPPAA